jgi:hypothetical protein
MKKRVGRPRSSLAAEDVAVNDPEAAMSRFREGLKKALEVDRKRAPAQERLPEQKRGSD